MKATARSLSLAPLWLCALLLCTVTGSASAGGGVEPLTLRLNDAIAVPGGQAALVIRTYASRPVGSGQLCLGTGGRCFGLRDGCRGAFRPAIDPSLGSLVDGYLVFSDKGDTQSWVRGEENSTQRLVLGFDSPSATVNQSDGPLAVIFLDIPVWAETGAQMLMEIDPANTVLFDEDGQSVLLEIRPGSLFIRHPDDPYTLELEGDEVSPGAVVTLSVESFEPKTLANGRVVIEYDPAIAAGAPTVRLDPRYGLAAFTADTSVPGQVTVDFESPNQSLNGIPGAFLQVDLPTRADVPRGTESVIRLRQDLTFLQATDGGHPIPLLLQNGTIEFE